MLKFRLTVMNFLQFFVWGSWLITIGAWWFQTRHWSGTQFGAIFSTMGIASLFMPSLMGIVADKWIRAERLYGILHLLGAVMLFIVPTIDDPGLLFWVMLVNMCFYMPTISLSITVAYNALKADGEDIVKVYPPIRVWGTVGFIAAMWTVSLLAPGNLAGTIPRRRRRRRAAGPVRVHAAALPGARYAGMTSLVDALGLRSFALMKNYKMAVFFIFAMFLGGSLQLTNAYGDTFLHDFAKLAVYQHALAIQYPAIIMSISQLSETLLILAIPFFLKRFGIKTVMLMSMFAWVLRFGLFAYGNPGGLLWMIVLSNIIYGMAFDFFNISGSLFVEGQADPKIRASAQGLFMLMTNGLGAVLGNLVAGWAIDAFFTKHACNDATAICKDWHGIWLAFAAYSLVVAVLFAILFRHKHQREPVRPMDAVETMAGTEVSRDRATAGRRRRQLQPGPRVARGPLPAAGRDPPRRRLRHRRRRQGLQPGRGLRAPGRGHGLPRRARRRCPGRGRGGAGRIRGPGRPLAGTRGHADRHRRDPGRRCRPEPDRGRPGRQRTPGPRLSCARRTPCSPAPACCWRNWRTTSTPPAPRWRWAAPTGCCACSIPRRCIRTWTSSCCSTPTCWCPTRANSRSCAPASSTPTWMPTKWPSLDDETLHALCRRLGTGTVVVTLGRHGCFVSHGASPRGDASTCYRVARRRRCRRSTPPAPATPSAAPWPPACRAPVPTASRTPCARPAAWPRCPPNAPVPPPPCRGARKSWPASASHGA